MLGNDCVQRKIFAISGGRAPRLDRMAALHQPDYMTVECALAAAAGEIMPDSNSHWLLPSGPRIYYA